MPVWATLIALMEGDEVYLGVVSAPALGRRWWASRGQGAWLSVFGGEPRHLHVSGVATLADASIAYSSLHGWRHAPGGVDGLLALERQVWRTRGYGDFWQHAMVAEGVVDAAAEPEVSLWDLAALAVLVEEAGGRFTDLPRPPRPRRRIGPVQQRHAARGRAPDAVRGLTPQASSRSVWRASRTKSRSCASTGAPTRIATAATRQSVSE